MNARNAVYSKLMWPQWNPTAEAHGTSAEQAEQLLDAYRNEVAIDIGRDALRDGLRPFLARLVGEPNAQGLLAAPRAAILREVAAMFEAEVNDCPAVAGCPPCDVRTAFATRLRRMADEATP